MAGGCNRFLPQAAGRILRRRRHGWSKQVGKTCKYYLMEPGRRAVLVELKLKEHLSRNHAAERPSNEPQRHSAAKPQPNCRVTRFNAEAAEVFAKGRRGNVFYADLRADYCVLCVKEIFAERDEQRRHARLGGFGTRPAIER